MEKVGKAIVKLRIPILILSVLLLIPQASDMSRQKSIMIFCIICPVTLSTMKGQDILMDDLTMVRMPRSL